MKPIKYHVFKTLTGYWRFTALDGIEIAGDCDTWQEAFDEAYSLASISRVEATA